MSTSIDIQSCAHILKLNSSYRDINKMLTDIELFTSIYIEDAKTIHTLLDEPVLNGIIEQVRRIKYRHDRTTAMADRIWAALNPADKARYIQQFDDIRGPAEPQPAPEPMLINMDFRRSGSLPSPMPEPTRAPLRAPSPTLRVIATPVRAVRVPTHGMADSLTFRMRGAHINSVGNDTDAKVSTPTDEKVTNGGGTIGFNYTKINPIFTNMDAALVALMDSVLVSGPFNRVVHQPLDQPLVVLRPSRGRIPTQPTGTVSDINSIHQAWLNSGSTAEPHSKNYYIDAITHLASSSTYYIDALDYISKKNRHIPGRICRASNYSTVCAELASAIRAILILELDDIYPTFRPHINSLVDKIINSGWYMMMILHNLHRLHLPVEYGRLDMIDPQGPYAA
jgi:hypothetical protein